MSDPVVVISEFMEAAAVERLASAHPTLYAPDLFEREQDLLRVISPARALIVRNRTQVRGPLLDAAARLEVVGRLGVGLDNIDLAACRAQGIAVCPATGANADSVAEYVVAAALQLVRGRAFFATEAVLAGDWPRGECQGGELAGRSLGLLGYGEIARRTGRRAAALGMAVIAHDPLIERAEGARLVPFAALLAEADVLSLHVPLTNATRGLIGADALARMKQGALLINTARGGVLDEAALASALRSGALGGAALDVFAQEPLSAEGAAVFRETPNLILTPHIAGLTAESNVRVSAVVADAVLRALDQT